MKQKIHRVLSLLLCCVMLVGLLPTTAFADYETGMECPDCGHYHWDTYMCFCGYCSEECTNATCWAENHCVRCGTCHEVTAYCAECGWCQECMEEEGHCLDCYKCVDSDDDLCQTCGKCEDCVGWLCMDCGQCDECTDNGEFHCEECGGCYETNGHNHGTHCADCCEICDQCGECIILNETEFCYECGLCEACCEENRDASDCSCGEYCVESVEFEEHFCEFCGNCFDDVEQCDLCYLCADCCADNSDCSDGMCVENDEYEEHFCEDCGSCFHDADQCETCREAGELRCVFCCESLASSYGCDCGEMCPNAPDFEDHLATDHPEGGEIGEHAAKPQNVWSMDGTDHWHGCRLCSEPEHITDKANHTYDKYGVCTVCGFKQGAPVFITHQPKDVYAKVTDINADESDPLHSQNNTVSFKVSAYGEGLRYQWYRVAGTGAPVALTTSDPRVPSYGEGATTDKVTVSVPGDACTTVYTYYCVVTDKDGHTAESIHARIKAGHVYSRCQNVATGTEKTIYVQSGETYETKKYQDSEGHYWSCCGEEDFGDGVTDFGNTRTKAPVSHNYGNQELIQATIYSDYAQAGKFSTYYRYTCSDCGHQIYVEKHTHNFECPVPGTEENNKYLEEHCTALTHPLVCTVGGCTETRTEQHRWEPWRIADYPTAEGPGHMRRECLDCQYPQDKEWTDKDGDPVQWTTGNMLVTAVHGTVNRSMAAPGDKLTLTPEQTDGRKCTGWTADYTDYSGETPVTKTVSVTVTQNSDGTWSCTVPTFAAMGVNGGGQLGFEAQFAACSHTGGTKTEGAREPVCTRNGYTGDTVCVDCGQILTVGDPIPGGTEHTGTLTLVPGTEVEADCTHRGYTGDFKCSACGGIVAGERTGYDHSTEGYDLVGYVEPTCTTEGYSGDEVCSNCRKVVSHGKNLPAAHGKTETVNFLSPTCTASGYSGDKVCKICDETVEWGKTTPPRGHNWNTGTVTKQPTETERGERLLTCLTCSETKIEYIPRLSVSDELISRVSASVQRPITGETPAEAVSSKPEQYTVIKTVWRSSPAVFEPDTVYWVRITLKANDGYRFPAVGESFQGYVNGNTATIGDRSTDQLTIEYTFPKTTPADHVHVFNQEDFPDEALVSEADCTNNAVYYYSCECGKIGTAETAGTFEREDSALGHDWSEDWSNDADNHWHVCTRCDEIDTETKAAHDFGDDDICDTCKYNREPSVADITAANVTVTAPAKGGTPANAATTDTQYTVANTVWEPANNPFAPNTVYSVLVTLEAKEGYQFTASTVFKINDSTATVVTQSAEEAKISFTFPATAEEAHAHIFDQEIIKNVALKTPADCTNDAVYYKSCSCGEISTDDAATFTAIGSALGHAWPEEGSWSKDADNHWYECSRCYEKKDKAAHDFGEDNICDTCNYDKSVPHTHNLTLVTETSATCTTPGNKAYYTCDGCDKWFEDASGSVEITDKTSVIIRATGHTPSGWKSDADNHWKECTVVGCGDVIDGSTEAHTASDWITDTAATATTDGTKHKECIVCHRVLENGTIPATGSGEHTHSYGSEWKSDADKHWHECSCGAKAEEAAHTASDWITDTAATAATDGTKHKECTVCKRVLETGTIPATGGEHTHRYSSDWKSDSINHWHECSCGDKDDVAAHSFKWVVDKEATANKKGSKHEECKVCGYERPAVEIPATGSTTKPTDPTESNPNTGALDDVPQTGDNSNMILWIVLLLASGLGVTGTVVYSKRKKYVK